MTHYYVSYSDSSQTKTAETQRFKDFDTAKIFMNTPGRSGYIISAPARKRTNIIYWKDFEPSPEEYRRLQLIIGLCDKDLNGVIQCAITDQEIFNNLPENMIDVHRIEYLSNCRQIQDYEATGVNLGYVEHLKNANFNLVNFYLTEVEK